MLQLLNLFIDICLFRRGPQDVPASLGLMYSCVAASLLASSIANWLAWQPGRPFGGFLVTLAMLLWLVIILLRWRKKMARLKQTLAALFGTDALMTVLGMPISAYEFPVEPSKLTQTDMLIAFAQLGLLAWTLLVIAHILRHALELPLFAASLIAVGWFMMALAAYGVLAGAPVS